MKNYFITASLGAALLLASCNLDDYTGGPTKPPTGKIELKNHFRCPTMDELF